MLIKKELIEQKQIQSNKSIQSIQSIEDKNHKNVKNSENGEIHKLDDELHIIEQKQEVKKENKHTYYKNALNRFLKQYYTNDHNLWTHTTLGPCIDDDGTHILIQKANLMFHSKRNKN